LCWRDRGFLAYEGGRMTYKYVDSNARRNENVLSVDFTFNGDVDMDEAVKQIDAMVNDIGNDYITFTSHEPRIFSISKYSSILE
jgi:hypothetical protein